MQGFNHIAGGLCFTGIFASFHDVNIFERPESIALTVVAAVLPDIDHTRSIIGKTVYPLAKWLSVKFGHRTITHSLVFYIGVLFATRFIEIIFFHDTTLYTIIIAYALMSHLVFDMTTRAGIAFFYPFSSRPCVLPANPTMRLRSNDLRSEAVIFILFNAMLLFCWPLFGAGFWMKYNETFMNYDHIRREAKRKDDLLEVTFTTPNRDTLSALLINSKETNFVTYNTTTGFHTNNANDIKFIAFRHTKKPFRTWSKQIFQVSPDSLKKHLAQPLIQLQIQSPHELFYYEGAVLKSGKTVQKEYIQGFNFYIEQQSTLPIEEEIKSIEAGIAAVRRAYQNEVALLRSEIISLETQLREGNRGFSQLSDYQKGRWIRQRPTLEKDLQGLRQQLTAKIPPDTQTDQLRIQSLRRQLVADKIVVSANLVGWER